jgi:hypothetical protein
MDRLEKNLKLMFVDTEHDDDEDSLRNEEEVSGRERSHETESQPDREKFEKVEVSEIPQWESTTDVVCVWWIREWLKWGPSITPVGTESPYFTERKARGNSGKAYILTHLRNYANVILEAKI